LVIINLNDSGNVWLSKGIPDEHDSYNTKYNLVQTYRWKRIL